MSRTNTKPREGELMHSSPAEAANTSHNLMTRRAALKAMFGLSVVTAGLFGSPLGALAAEASKETTDALNSAQSQLDAPRRSSTPSLPSTRSSTRSSTRR